MTHQRGLLNGLLSAKLPESSSAIDERIAPDELHRAILAVREDLGRSQKSLDAVSVQIEAMPATRLDKKGYARGAARAVLIAYKCVTDANESLLLAIEGGPLSVEHLRLARDFSWHAARFVGVAEALIVAASPGPRPGSRSAQFQKLFLENQGMSVARVNSLLEIPLDDATARRYARNVRAKPKARHKDK